MQNRPDTKAVRLDDRSDPIEKIEDFDIQNFQQLETYWEEQKEYYQEQFAEY